MTAILLEEICPALSGHYGLWSFSGYIPLNMSVESGWLAWDPSAGAAAIAGGLASGLAAMAVFSLGIYVERYKVKRSNVLKQAEAAISSVFKLRAWLDVGAKTGKYVRDSIGDKNAGEEQLFPHVFPLLHGGHEPELLTLEDLSFLISIDEVDLLQDLLELQAWSKTMRSAMQEYSRMRAEWDTWVPLNSKSATLKDGGIVSGFSGEAVIGAQIRVKKMDSLLHQIVGMSDSQEYYISKVQYYIDVCKNHFKEDFPQKMKFKLETA